jgi:predicted RNase H-like HicB family nuclease
MKYAVVFERSSTGYAAYVPDLPGCVTTGQTLDETEQHIREAIAFHIESLRDHGEPVPEPTSKAEYVEVAAG